MPAHAKAKQKVVNDASRMGCDKKISIINIIQEHLNINLNLFL